MAIKTTKSAMRSDSEWIPSAIKPCDLEKMPAAICATVNKKLTTTLIQVLFDAAAARSALVCVLSCVFSRSVNCKRTSFV